MLCPHHRILIPLLHEAQRIEKRERSEWSRNATEGKKNPHVKALTASIDTRRMHLFNIHFGSSLECDACYMVKTITTAVLVYRGRDILLDCLPSSMVERFFRKEEAVSSSLAGGSKVLQEA